MSLVLCLDGLLFNGRMNVVPNSPVVRAYGLWSSSLHADVLMGGVRLGDAAWDERTGQLVWSESREGHGTLFAAGPSWCQSPRQLTTGLNVRGRLGYGGGEFAVAAGYVYFAGDGGRLYRQSVGINDPRPITPAFGAAAAPAVHPTGRFVAYVHSVDDVDRIALVDSEGTAWPHILAEGADFYMQPAWHPEGTLFAYVSWNFPDMPWDRATLHLARFDESAPGGPRLRDVQALAGGDGSVMQPTFSPDGRLLTYISETTGFWHLYAYDLLDKRVVQLTDGPFEHGVPAWVQGQRNYAFAPDGRSVFYIRNDKGFHRVLQCTLYDEDDQLRPMSTEVRGDFNEYAVISQISVGTDPSGGDSSRGGSSEGDLPLRIAFIGEGPTTPPRIVVAEVNKEATGSGGSDGRDKDAKDDQVDARGESSPQSDPGVALPARIYVVRRSRAEHFSPGVLSVPENFSWAAADGTEVHGLYYPPANPQFEGGPGAPPTVISIHSGPTRQSLPEFNGKAQYFTSRGYAYVEPNYRGSTGFGRAYREKLQGQWGVVDVEDTLDGARWLVENGRADGDRLIVMGSSSGGYSALRALAEAPGFFKAAINMYGVVDLFGLAMDTHKFERHYTDGLVGALPEAAAVYRERSPVFHGDKIRDPVAVFQGTADPVVPKEQSDAVVAALRRNGVPCEYHVYEGEGHGWRRAETVRAVYDAIDKFLKRFVLFS